MRACRPERGADRAAGAARPAGTAAMDARPVDQLSPDVRPGARERRRRGDVCVSTSEPTTATTMNTVPPRR